ncbi:MAG: H/ACA ribonucleoprotein complex subunit GAR1 [Promethearchaeota archaeon]
MQASSTLCQTPLKSLPKIGIIVYDSQMTAIGKIWDIFGPVSKFFISIAPKNRNSLSYFSTQINEPVYIIRSKKSKKAKFSKKSKNKHSKRPMKKGVKKRSYLK